MATTTGFIDYTEQAAPANPAASHQRLFVRSSDHLFCGVNSSGTVTPLALGGAATGSGLTMSTARLLGRTTASTGAIEEITVGSGLTLSAGALTASGGGSGALAFLEAHTANNTSTNLDFTTFVSSTYDNYLIKIVGLVPATNTASIYLLMGTGGGPTYDTTSGHYQHRAWRWNVSGNAINGSDSDSKIIIDGGAGVTGPSSTATNGGLTGSYDLMNPGSGSIYPTVVGLVSDLNSSSNYEMAQVHGRYIQTTAITALRFTTSSGNISSGTVRIYGVSKT